MYRSKTFRVRSNAEVDSDIDKASAYFKKVGLFPEKVFFIDGDALCAPTDTLLNACKRLNNTLPGLKQISLYATVKNVLEKSPEELKKMAENRLSLAYIGLESGCDTVLKKVAKGNTGDEVTLACLKLKEAGWKTSLIAMLGLGGREHSATHCEETSRIVCASRPDFFSFLSTTAVPGTPYFNQIKKGVFTPLSYKELLIEMRNILGGLKGLKDATTIFRANHVSNHFPLSGTLPQDVDKLLEVVNHWISSCPDDVFPDNNPYFL